MRTATRHASGLLGIAAAALVLGCPSAYERTYQQETQRLETEQQLREDQERAAHAEARRYAAVVYFDVGSAVVKEEGYRELTWFVEKLRPYPQAIIQVQGFADATGGDARNQDLSEQRARNVAQFLASQGIEPPRIVVQGFASEFPAQPNVTAEGRRSNRRVEVTVR